MNGFYAEFEVIVPKYQGEGKGETWVYDEPADIASSNTQSRESSVTKVTGYGVRFLA